MLNIERKPKPTEKLLTVRLTKAGRIFEFQMNAPVTDWLVFDVVCKLEIEELLIFYPDDKRAFSVRSERGTLPIKILDWFPIACQLIQEVRIEDPDTYALFCQNAYECLFRGDGQRPIGPADLQCEIQLSRRLFSPRNRAAPDAIRCVIAHELAHAFDLLQFSAPAVLDWDEFWKKPLAKGKNCDRVLRSIEDLTLKLDDYGSTHELESLMRFWPSYAGEWFDAMQKLRSGE